FTLAKARLRLLAFGDLSFESLVGSGECVSALCNVKFKFVTSYFESFLCLFLVIYVCTRAEPFNDPPFVIARCRGASQVPTIHAVRCALESILHFVLFASFQRARPKFQALIEIIGVENHLPVPAFRFFQR